MQPELLNYYEAIERASTDMLEAARAGHWDEVTKALFHRDAVARFGHRTPRQFATQKRLRQPHQQRIERVLHDIRLARMRAARRVDRQRQRRLPAN